MANGLRSLDMLSNAGDRSVSSGRNGARIGLDDAKILARVLKIDFDLERITVNPSIFAYDKPTWHS